MTDPMTVLVLLMVCLPLVWLLTLLLPGRWQRFGMPLLPLPALLVVAFYEPGWQLALQWLMIDSFWLVDDLRRTFLTLAGLLWCSAGLFALGYLGDQNLKRFLACWCLTLCGNLGLIVAGDAASFYGFFALMTFAAYGLVVHQGSDEARHAGRVYMAMAVAGEMLLLAGLLLTSEQADSLLLSGFAEAIVAADHPHVITALLVAGFGVKAGLPLLHFWLPLAHPVAPTPASAVLSGVMIKAGLLGWILALPLGQRMGYWGDAAVLAGAIASLGGAAAGVCQREPKAVLAYSSISQMGLILLLAGAALAATERAEAILPVIGVYALHHGLAKGSLFLSSAVNPPARRSTRWLYWVLVALPGFSLAGLPWTSGALAKLAMKEALAEDQVPLATAPWLSPLMTIGAIATLLLILRFLWLRYRQAKPGRNSGWCLVGWSLALAGSAVLFWQLPWQAGHLVDAPFWTPKAYQIPALLFPIGLALVIGLAAAWKVHRAPSVPKGDLLSLWPTKGGFNVSGPASVWRQFSTTGRAADFRTRLNNRTFRFRSSLPALSAALETLLQKNGLTALVILVLLLVLSNHLP